MDVSVGSGDGLSLGAGASGSGHSLALNALHGGGVDTAWTSGAGPFGVGDADVRGFYRVASDRAALVAPFP